MKALMTVQEIAEFLQCSEKVIQDFIDEAGIEYETIDSEHMKLYWKEETKKIQQFVVALDCSKNESVDQEIEGNNLFKTSMIGYEISKVLGIKKNRIYKCIKTLGLVPLKQDKNKTIYSVKDCQKVYSYFENEGAMQNFKQESVGNGETSRFVGSSEEKVSQPARMAEFK